MKATQAETDQQVAATVLRLTVETREAVEDLHARDVARNGTLHDEFNAMAAQLEKGHDLLARKGDALQANLDETAARLSQTTGAGTAPEGPPGLVSEQLVDLQAAVESLVARLHVAEAKDETFEAAIRDAQAKIDKQDTGGQGEGVPSAEHSLPGVSTAGQGVGNVLLMPSQAPLPDRTKRATQGGDSRWALT